MEMTKSEDVLGQKWDHCISDTVVKTGGGILIGAVSSLLLFRRRKWPVIFGAGGGFGMGYANCQRLFDEPYLVRPQSLTISPK